MTDSQALYSYANYQQAARFLDARTGHKPTVALILGSGLGALAEEIVDKDVIPYARIPGFPTSSAPSHQGQLVIGKLCGIGVIAMQGRIHLYEGYSPAEIAFPVRVMQMMGAETLLVTNAAGGINRNYLVGDLMAIEDHINFPGMTGNDPLRGPNLAQFGPRFTSMTQAYSGELLSLAETVARAAGIALRKGVYACLAGPTFETPAEIRMLRTVGADAVGMSTVPEVLVARHAGMRVLGISAITNLSLHATGSGTETTEEEVWQSVKIILPKLSTLVKGIVTAV